MPVTSASSGEGASHVVMLGDPKGLQSFHGGLDELGVQFISDLPLIIKSP